MADEPEAKVETIQTHVDKIALAITNAEAFTGSIENGATRDAAIKGLSGLHTEAARLYRHFKDITTHDETTRALRSPADDKD